MLLQFQPISWLNRLPREIPLCGKALLYFTGWMLCSMKPNIVQTEHKAKLVWALLKCSQYSIKLNTCSTLALVFDFSLFWFFCSSVKGLLRYCKHQCPLLNPIQSVEVGHPEGNVKPISYHGYIAHGNILVAVLCELLPQWNSCSVTLDRK